MKLKIIREREEVFNKCRQLARNEIYPHFVHEDPTVENQLRYTVSVALRTNELMKQRGI